MTGGSGFVGRNLVKELSRLGKNVVVVDLTPSPEAESRIAGVEYVRADLRDYGDVLLALQGVDTVFHIAGNASGTLSVEYPRLDFQTNAVATCNVGNACLQLGVRRLVYLSSAIVYGTPQYVPMTEEHPTSPFLPYGASKLSGEFSLLSLEATADLPVVIGRSFVIYGPGEDPRTAGGEVSQFLRWHLNERKIPVVGDIDRKTRDFIHVFDLCAALIKLAEVGQSGEIYNLGSGQEVSMRELADTIGAATGRKAVLEPDESQLEDSFRLVADTSKLFSLGFKPSIPLQEGIRYLASDLGEFPELPTTAAKFRRDSQDEQYAAKG
ncbi:NAD-dependent epimerase/dehydratase family protein [Salinactinospora qingdaonensis]|uniref:NAD-dependent epimerase/dehydratase family protein n=1 Tax=Salinactinospora qingdaonensis TaxID=702744 RepID=UPI0031E83B8B